MGAMKLLLSSCSIVRSPWLISALRGLLPLRPGSWRICHIVTASIAGRAADRSWAAEAWVAEEERQLQGHGFLCESLDLAAWPGPDLAEHLASFDVLYVQGGNTFYLLEQMRRSGADRIIQELVAAQGVLRRLGWKHRRRPGDRRRRLGPGLGPQRGRTHGSHGLAPGSLHPLAALRSRGRCADRRPAAAAPSHI